MFEIIPNQPVSSSSRSLNNDQNDSTSEENEEN